jgi:aspartate carbamoyltransferase regulatory subunit
MMVISAGMEPKILVRYVHILLFACPDCNLPVSISRVSNEKNLETVDAERLHIKCSYCEKPSDVTVVTAKRHYVEEWT